MDRSATFELYYDPEISAPESILPLPASPNPKSPRLHSPTPAGFKSSPQLLLSSRRSLRTSGSTGRLVLGELPLRTRVNPFHRSQRNKLSSCGRRQSATCDSRLKHEIHLCPEVSAPSNHLNASGGDKVEVKDCLPHDLPALGRPHNLRRSTACGLQTRTARNETAGDIILPSDNSTCFASGSSTPAIATFSSGAGHSSSLSPFSLSSATSTVSQGVSQIDSPSIVDETKENVPLARKQASLTSHRAIQTPAKTVEAPHFDHVFTTTYQSGNNPISSGVQASHSEGSSISVSSQSSQCRLNAAKSRPSYDPSNRRHPRSLPWANSGEVPGALPVLSTRSSLTLHDPISAQQRHRSLPNTPMRI